MARYQTVNVIDTRGRRRARRPVPARGRRAPMGVVYGDGEQGGANAGKAVGSFLTSIVASAVDVAAKGTGSFIREIKTAVQEPSPAQKARWDRKRYDRQLSKQKAAMNKMAARLRQAEIEQAKAKAVLAATAAVEVEPDAEPEDVAEAALSGLGYGAVEVESGTFGGYGGEGRGVDLLGRWGRTRLVLPPSIRETFSGGQPGQSRGVLRGVRHVLSMGESLVVGSKTGRPISIDLGNGLHVVGAVDQPLSGDYTGAEVVDAIERATAAAINSSANPGGQTHHWTAYLPWKG